MADRTTVDESPPPPPTSQTEESELSAEELNEVSGGKANNLAGSHTAHNNYTAQNSSGNR